MSLNGSMVCLANSKQPNRLCLSLWLCAVRCLLFARSAFRNPHSKIEKSRAKQRGTSSLTEVFRVRSFRDSPELFSRLFYVAASRLNSPRFSFLLIRRSKRGCQALLPRFEHDPAFP